MNIRTIMAALVLSASAAIAAAQVAPQAGAELPAKPAPTAPKAEGKIEARLRAIFEKELGGKVDAVAKAPYPGLYEVHWEGKVAYTDADAKYFLLGMLFDMPTKRNLTKESINRLSAVAWKDLPLDWSIKQVKGDGSRKLAVFEDPFCGYCKMLRKTFEELNNVTIYTFLLPVIAEESMGRSVAVWCSADPVKAWGDWMVRDIAPAEASCEHPLEKVVQFALKARITGTPTVFFPDGTRASGAIPLLELEQKLSMHAAGSAKNP